MIMGRLHVVAAPVFYPIYSTYVSVFHISTARLPAGGEDVLALGPVAGTL